MQKTHTNPQTPVQSESACTCACIEESDGRPKVCPSYDNGAPPRSAASHTEGRNRPDCSHDPHHNIDLGARGELAAARFLERRGMEILERNWTCCAGEADIIARDEDAIHFVEVKTRSNVDCGFPSEAVNRAKRERCERIAASYLTRCDVVDVAVMFDIISIVVTGPNRAFLRFHRNAFCGCE